MSALGGLLALTLLGAAPTASTAPSPLAREGRMLFEAAPSRLEARVGEWVTYQMDGVKQLGFMRLAVVGEQKDAQGRDAVWVELEFGQHPEFKAPMAQYLMLVARDVGLRTEGVTRLFATQGIEKLQEVEPADLPALFGAPAPAEPRPSPPAPVERLPAGPQATVIRGKPASVMTLAGTVMAEPMEVRYRQLVLKRYWISRDVPVLHLAKIEFPPIHHTMEVRDHGVDARPRMVLPSPSDKKMILGTEQQIPARFNALLPSESDSEPKDAPP